MANNEFGLPGSSMGEIIKIIIGYSHTPGEATLDTISKLVGVHKTVISRNNQFLSDIGVIEGGQKKKVTELGIKLGRAFEHRQDEDIRKYLQTIISENAFLSNLITTLRIKNTMSQEDFAKHIVYVSGQKDTKENRTGSRTIIEILTMSGLIIESNGSFNVATGLDKPLESKKIIHEKLDEANIEEKAEADVIKEKELGSKIQFQPTPIIAINIQLQIPESDKPEVYENLFKSLRKYLIDGEN